MSRTTEVGNIYENVRIMLANREVQLLSEDKLTLEQISQTMEASDYITIYGYRAKSDIRVAAGVAALIVSRDSKYSTRTQDFDKLITSIGNNASMKTCLNRAGTAFVNIIVIINNTLRKVAKTTDEDGKSTLSSLLQKKINLSINIDPTALLVEVYNYKLFSINILNHFLSQPHAITSDSELKLVTEILRKPVNEFPKINISDPQVVWLGARVGQVVKISRVSDSAGVFHTYRLVVAGEIMETPT